jgi:hypothetical protein
MLCRLRSWIASLFFALAFCSAAAAQNPNLPLPGLDPNAPPPPPPPSVPVLEYTLAFICTAGVLVLVCYPARRN